VPRKIFKRTYDKFNQTERHSSMWEQHKKAFGASAGSMWEQHKKDFGQVCKLKRDEVAKQTFKHLKKMWYLHTKQNMFGITCGEHWE
jgi:hypothetical protein